jgi:very-short-patch-repair endonuclease
MVGMSDHEALRNLAERQHGVVSRHQLVEIGFTPQSLAHAVDSGRLDRLSERVLRLRGSASTRHQRAMAAALDVPGGAIAIRSAAALWGQPGFTPEPWHVLTGRRPHRGGQRLGIVHSSVRWSVDDVTSLHGIPVTTPLRTLTDLAGRLHPDHLSQVCDRMLSGRLVRLGQLHSLGSALPERSRRPANAALRRLVEARPPGYRPAESNLERRFESIVAAAGEAPFERQVDLGDDDGWIGRVDFVDRKNRIVVEVQSDLFHSGLVDRARDRERVTRLRRAGWIVVEISEFEIWHRKGDVVAKIRSARLCGSRGQA